MLTKVQLNKPLGLLLMLGIGCLVIFLWIALIAFFSPQVQVVLSDLPQRLISWDAGFYLSIMAYDYIFIPGEQCNAAFFPLFPWVAKLMGINTVLISVMNLGVALLSILLFKKYFNSIGTKSFLLLFLFPSFLFVHVPYSEAFFFLGSVLILIALRNQQRSLMVLGILIAGLSRPAAMVLIPGFCLIYIIELYTCKGNWKKHTVDFSFYLTTSVLTVLSVLYLQYLQTGVWNAYGKAIAAWGFGLEVPSFPFGTMEDGAIAPLTFVLDALAYGVGLIALFYLIKVGLNILKRQKMVQPDLVLVFSCVYLFMTLFFRIISQDGQLTSMNRYIFCTPFVMILLQHLLVQIQSNKIKSKHVGSWMAVVFISMVVNVGKTFILLTPTFLLVYLAFYLIKQQSIYLNRYWIFLCVLFSFLHALAFLAFLQFQWVA